MVLLLLSVGWFGALILFFILFKADVGYLHLARTFWRCSCSSCKCCVVKHTALALWKSVLITLYLAEMAWWLSCCKYLSVWVGFLKTGVVRLASVWGMTRVSRKGIEPSTLVFWAVNCIPSSMELLWLRIFLYVLTWWLQKCHPHIFSTDLRLWWCAEGFDFKFFHVLVGHNGAYGWSHGYTLQLLEISALEYKVCVL